MRHLLGRGLPEARPAGGQPQLKAFIHPFDDPLGDRRPGPPLALKSPMRAGLASPLTRIYVAAAAGAVASPGALPPNVQERWPQGEIIGDCGRAAWMRRRHDPLAWPARQRVWLLEQVGLFADGVAVREVGRFTPLSLAQRATWTPCDGGEHRLRFCAAIKECVFENNPLDS